MTRHLDVQLEQADARRHNAIVKAVEYELPGALGMSGVELRGFSVRLGEWETLVTLRGIVDGVPSVAFVGADNLGSALLKCVREGRRGKLRWRVDQYGKDGG